MKRPASEQPAARRKPATLIDVAGLAGVSTATVSRALSHPQRVSPQTRETVLRAIRELDFVANAAGRSLKEQRTKTMLIDAGDLGNPFNGEVLRGAQIRAHELGYSLVLGPPNGAAKDEATLSFLRSGRVDGLALLWDPFLTPDDLIRLGSQFPLPPIVGVREGGATPPYPHVSLDNEAAARDMAGLFLRTGHRTFAIVTTNDGRSPEADRVRGMLDALSETGIQVPDDWIFECTQSTVDGRAIAASLSRLRALPSAILCTNDIVAAGVIAGLSDLGFRVPRDVSVSGFDDLEMVDCLDPPLTTVRQPRELIGRTTVELLAGVIEGTVPLGYSQNLLLELRVRSSVATGRHFT